MSDILCLASAPWQSVPTRTQQLMSRMGDDTQVLFFEPPVHRGDRSWQKPGRRLRPHVTVYSLPPIRTHNPRGGFWDFLHRRDCQRLTTFIQSRLERHNIKEPLLWCTTPENVHMLDYLAYHGLVYDCDRYWAGLPLQWESDLALNADLVFAASAGLADRLSPCCSNIAVLPNGCNYPMFCRDDLDTPPGMAELTGPVLGYCGTLWADLDLAPLIALAQSHPNWNIVLLGRAERSRGLDELESLPNVHFFGRKPLVEVPEYVARFHVCLDLQRTTVPGDDVIPSRVYEYLAAGKPVVQMGFPGQVPELSDVVYHAVDTEGFIRQCERAVSSDPPWLPVQRRDRGADAAWSRRADQVIQILEANGLY